MEFDKNARTHGKVMVKIFVNKKNVVMHILSSPCDMIELDTFFNYFMPGICLNFVMEKNNFVMENSRKTHGKLMGKNAHSGVGTQLRQANIGSILYLLGLQ